MGKNYFDQFDETPAMQLSSPAGVTEVAPPGGQGFISLGPVGTLPPRSVAPIAPAGGNYFDRFDLQSQPPALPAWPDWMTGSTSSFGPNGLPDWMTDPAPAPAPAPAPPAGGNFFDQFDEPAPPAAAANPPVASQPLPRPLYSQFIRGIKNAFNGDYGRTRQWFADNGYGDLLGSAAPSQSSMFDRYWTLLGQYDADTQQADAARKVGFGEAFAREGLRGLAGITEYENRLLSPAYWGIDATSRALTGYNPNFSAIPDYEAEQRNSLAIQPYEELTLPGQIGAGFGQALPMAATAPLAEAALPAKALATVPEVAPTLWNATRAVAAKIPQGIGAMMPSAALAAQDAADQGRSVEDQLRAASLAMAMGAIPMLAESHASSIPLRIAERGAKSAALTVPVNAWINNLQDPNRRTTAGFTPDDIVSAIPQIVTGALVGRREMPFRAPLEAKPPMAHPTLRGTTISSVPDPFLDRMRAALDGDAERKMQGGEATVVDPDAPIPPTAAIWRKGPVELTELKSPMFNQPDLKDAWRAARVWVRSLFGVKADNSGPGISFLNRDTGHWITSSGNFIDHGLRFNSEKHPNLRQHIQAAEVLDKLIERAVKLVDYAPSKGEKEGDPNLHRIYRYVAPFRVGGRTYLVKLTAKEYVENNHKYYDHRLTEIKELTGEPKPPGQEGVGSLPVSGATPQPKLNVRDLLRGVKMGDLSSTLPLVDPNWGEGSGLDTADPFLAGMRAALDANARGRRHGR